MRRIHSTDCFLHPISFSVMFKLHFSFYLLHKFKASYCFFFCFLRRTQFHHPLICTHCKSALLGTSWGVCSVSYSHLQLLFFPPPASTPPRQPSDLHFYLEATSLLCLIQTSKHFLFCMCFFLPSSTFTYPVLELVSCTKVPGPLMSYKYMSGTRPNRK